MDASNALFTPHEPLPGTRDTLASATLQPTNINNRNTPSFERPPFPLGFGSSEPNNDQISVTRRRSAIPKLRSPPSPPRTMRSSTLLPLLATLTTTALADVKFTTPAAGASIAAGTLTVEWEDSGDSPPLSDLSTYTLQLIVGGNTDANSVCDNECAAEEMVWHEQQAGNDKNCCSCTQKRS